MSENESKLEEAKKILKDGKFEELSEEGKKALADELFVELGDIATRFYNDVLTAEEREFLRNSKDAENLKNFTCLSIATMMNGAYDMRMGQDTTEKLAHLIYSVLSDTVWKKDGEQWFVD